MDRKDNQELIFAEMEEFELNLHRYLFQEIFHVIDNYQINLKFFPIIRNSFRIFSMKGNPNNYFFPVIEQKTNGVLIVNLHFFF